MDQILSTTGVDALAGRRGSGGSILPGIM